MTKANEIGMVTKQYEMRSSVVECTEKGRYCMGKFTPTRPGQTDICIKCLEMLDDLQPLPKSVNKNIYSNG